MTKLATQNINWHNVFPSWPNIKPIMKPIMKQIKDILRAKARKAVGAWGPMEMPAEDLKIVIASLH